MGKQKKKFEEKTIRLALITAIISLIEKIVELIIKLLEIAGGR